MNEKEPPAFYRIPLDMEAEMKRIERKELIKSAKMIQDKCINVNGDCMREKVDCPFQRKMLGDFVCILDSRPKLVFLPEVQDDD